MKDREVVPNFESAVPDTSRQKITMSTNKKTMKIAHWQEKPQEKPQRTDCWRRRQINIPPVTNIRRKNWDKLWSDSPS
jgi:hypothetical protein